MSVTNTRTYCKDKIYDLIKNIEKNRIFSTQNAKQKARWLAIISMFPRVPVFSVDIIFINRAIL